MSDDTRTEYGLLLPFDSDDPEFCRGFEVGHVWTRLEDNAEAQSFTVHATNTEMLIRIAEALGRSWVATVQDDTWVEIEFGAPDA